MQIIVVAQKPVNQHTKNNEIKNNIPPNILLPLLYNFNSNPFLPSISNHSLFPLLSFLRLHLPHYCNHLYFNHIHIHNHFQPNHCHIGNNSQPNQFFQPNQSHIPSITPLNSITPIHLNPITPTFLSPQSPPHSF